MKALFAVMLIIGCIVTFARQVVAKEEPVKALFILGGEHHRYEEGSQILAEFLKTRMEIQFDFVRIDQPPEGKPNAEKTVVPSRPEILEDPDLRRKYDLILAYNQEAYTNLTPKQRDGYLHFVRSGGPWLGIHSAADFLKNDPDYVRMVGGKFKTHPPFGEIHVQRVLGDHYVVEGIGDFTTRDEFYYLADCPLTDKEILLVAKGPNDGKTRPVAWCKRYGKGKVFYTILGHAPECFRNPNFMNLMERAVRWAVTTEVGETGSNGWIPLFNGRDFTGWTHCGPGRFTVEDGCLKTEGGMGLLWFHGRSFKDFTLSLEYKTGRKEDNSGIYVRFPNKPRDEWQPVYEGYEIQIGDIGPEKHNTGSVYGFKGSTKIPSEPIGEWNLMEITVRGQEYIISLNDEEITDFEGERGREGYIGLQNHDARSILWFRNLMVKEL